MPSGERAPLGFGHYLDKEDAPAVLPADWREPKDDGHDWIRSQAVVAEREEYREAEERQVLDREREVHSVIPLGLVKPVADQRSGS